MLYPKPEHTEIPLTWIGHDETRDYYESKDNQVFSHQAGSTRFYCYKSSWEISPAFNNLHKV